MIPAPLAKGFCFGEGPRWFEGLLWFSDMLGEAVHTVDPGGSLTTLPLPEHAPSGLGFRPDGSLLIVSTENRQLLRYDGESVITIADLSDVAPADLGDMVVDHLGRAYIGSQAFQGGVIVRVDPRYYRPTEVETLLGDPTKAKEKLGWTPTTTLSELVAEMIDADYNTARRDALVSMAGFQTFQHHE